MKRLLLILTVLIGAQTAYGQCTPDPQYTAPGIYPDSATGLAPAFVGMQYEEIVTAVVPMDTLVEIIPGFPQTVTIDSINVDNITGLPPGFAYECVSPTCSFPGGTSGCMRIYSISNPTIADTGRYYLTIDLTAYSIISQSSQVGYYYIDVIDSSQLSTSNIEGERIEMKQNSPNPVADVTYIDYVSGTNTSVKFTVTNLLGEVVHTREYKANRGNNRIKYDASALNAGIYLYTIDNGNVVYGKKMIVK